jgi:hypothetical protein
MIVADVPQATAPKLVETAIAVWGDAKALTDLKREADSLGWLTSWATTGPQNYSLMIAVDGSTPSNDVRSFVDAVNKKKFGNLNAGFATFGDPPK